MMFGRIGSFFGNFIFPYFLLMGCLPTFLLIGGVAAAGGFLCIFLPETNKKPLK